jgi:uncharacterized NAD(P)/FAD-binding protein YdhS
MTVHDLIESLRQIDPLLPTNVESVEVSPSMVHGVSFQLADAAAQMDSKVRDLAHAVAEERAKFHKVRDQVARYREILRRIKALVRSRRIPAFRASC